MSKTISIGCRLPEDMLRAVDAAAQANGQRRNDIVKAAIARFIESGDVLASKSA